MTTDFLQMIATEVFKTVMYVAAPALLTGLVVGLFVGFVQSITQIQEFTLTFVPKMLAVFSCLLLLMPYMSEKLITFTTNLIKNIPDYIR